MNKFKRHLSHLRQKELEWLKRKKTTLDGYHYPKDDEMYKRMTEWSCFNCESMFFEGNAMMCDDGSDYTPCQRACDKYSSCGKDRLREPLKSLKIVDDYEG